MLPFLFSSVRFFQYLEKEKRNLDFTFILFQLHLPLSFFLLNSFVTFALESVMQSLDQCLHLNINNTKSVGEINPAFL
jgi:hypothetical protein